MNKLTRKIKDKGYSLPEFCKVQSICLRTYRTYEKEDHALNEMLVRWVDDLESKNG